MSFYGVYQFADQKQIRFKDGHRTWLVLLRSNGLIRESLWKMINLSNLAALNLPYMCASAVLIVIVMFFAGCTIEWLRKTIMHLFKLEKLLHKADDIANVAVEWVMSLVSPEK